MNCFKQAIEVTGMEFEFEFNQKNRKQKEGKGKEKKKRKGEQSEERSVSSEFQNIALYKLF